MSDRPTRKLLDGAMQRLEYEVTGDVQAAWAAAIEQRARRAFADPNGGIPWETVRDELRSDRRR